MKEVEVLSDNGCCWPRKIQRERVFHRPKVMKLEDEVFWKVSLVSPDNPSDTNVAQAEFMATVKKL